MISILIVEDDALIGHATEQWLGSDNQVRWARTLVEARNALESMDFDIVLLDLGLPDGNGLELISLMKRRKLATGILIMTAFGDVDQRVEGLDSGADDYLIKPLDFKELDARIRAVKRRKDGILSNVIERGALLLDLQGMTVSLNNSAVHLSRMEFSILAILMQGMNRYHSKNMLEQRLYEVNSSFEGNAIEVHISALRKKLGKTLIKTTRGLGYIIENSS